MHYTTVLMCFHVVIILVLHVTETTSLSFDSVPVNESKVEAPTHLQPKQVEEQEHKPSQMISVWSTEEVPLKPEFTQIVLKSSGEMDQEITEESRQEKVGSEEVPEKKVGTTEEDYEYEESDEEIDCPEEQFYHIRGKRCVLVICPGGNNWRDINTGECILRHYGGGNGRRRWGYSRRTNAHPPFSGRSGGRWWYG